MFSLNLYGIFTWPQWRVVEVTELITSWYPVAMQPLPSTNQATGGKGIEEHYSISIRKAENSLFAAFLSIQTKFKTDLKHSHSSDSKIFRETILRSESTKKNEVLKLSRNPFISIILVSHCFVHAFNYTIDLLLGDRTMKNVVFLLLHQETFYFLPHLRTLLLWLLLFK